MNQVIVVGAGGAGLVAALSAKQSGADVVVITKEYPTRSQTCMAQGGINAVLYDTYNDSVEQHIQNTLKSALGLADENSVRFMCTNAPEALMWLDSIGVAFSRTEDGKIAQRKLGGAAAPRACYAQDYTGLKILHTLYDSCIKEGITFLNERFLLDIITQEGNNKQIVCGVSVLNKKNGEVEVYNGSSVILATGGYSRVYNNYSTNSLSSTGDGIAAALRAGAKLGDMEFIQFHPTALKNSSILISESARGAGGYLINSKGERFVDELLSRDLVSRAIDDEMQRGEEVFLDIRHLGEKFIEEELPQEAKLAKLYENVDVLKDVIPIKPSAHYTMGGIIVDKDAMSCIDGLFAAGECANHRVHGANRLGGNSLLEIVVFGRVAGESAAKYIKNTNIDKQGHLQKAKDKIQEYLEYEDSINFYDKQKYLGELFYKNAGIKRDKAGLEDALKVVIDMKQNLPKMGVKDKTAIYNTNLINFMEFVNMLDISQTILISAIARDESRGAHYRVDEKERDERFCTNSIIDKGGVVSYAN